MIKNEQAFTLVEMKDTKNVDSSVKKKNRQSGFTLIEMMIVLLVIAVLLIITIPNVAKHHTKINEKGCSAFVKMVQSQVQAYRIDKNEIPSMQQLLTEEYITETTCPDGRELTIDENGTVK